MALSVDRPGKRRRLVGKHGQQAALLEQVVGEENRSASREVHLVTLPHADKEGLEAPAGLMVLTEYRAPVAGVRRARCRVALRLGKTRKFLAVKRALLNRYQLASHWSCSRDGRWSAVGHFANATPKPRSALGADYLAWPAEHPPLTAAKSGPTTARAADMRRTAREQVEGEKWKPEPRVEEVDLWPIAVRSGIRNSLGDPRAVRKLMARAKTPCSRDVVAWMFKNEHVLEKNVDISLEDATEPIMQQFKEALRAPFVCGGRWLHRVRESPSMNRIDVPDLCSSISMSLQHGRSEAAPVVALAGRFGREGESLLFSAARPLFGGEHVQERPGGGQFCLRGVDEAKAAVLDEWMFAEEDLPLSIQLLWLEGKPALVIMPQNQHVGHNVGSAPISITCPETALAGMLLRRLKLNRFTVPVPKPPAPKPAPCPRCFLTLVTSEALAFKPR
ncbi:unnamed protein product [Prorocentrum cordatum]|uniref:JmjC domain-containing protein n=1 Tax=Prorocentrum cordatum TaxID=2364126 RepID=A0ABN9T366_9DINO|nr:unnamed protein product [Polarella glacialis]